MDQKKVDLQRDVVLNELRQSYENQPYGRAELAIQQLLYPPSHPYHFPTIGTRRGPEGRRRVGREGLLRDVLRSEQREPRRRGRLRPRGDQAARREALREPPAGQRAAAQARSLPAARRRPARRDVRQGPAPARRLRVPHAAGDDAGRRRVRPPRLGARGRQEQPPLQAPRHRRQDRRPRSRRRTRARRSARSSGSTSRRGRTPISAASRRPWTRRSPVSSRRASSPGELAQRRETTELAKLSALQRLETRADFMNFYEDAWGDPNGFKRDLDRYRDATPEAVLATAKQVLTQDARVVYRVLPEQPKRVASARDARPADGPAAAFRPTPPERFKLANGIPVELWRTPDLPLTRVSAVFRPEGRSTPGRGGGARVVDGRDARRGRRDAGRARVRRGRRGPRGKLLLGRVAALRAGEPHDPLAQRRAGRAAPRGRRAPAAPFAPRTSSASSASRSTRSPSPRTRRPPSPTGSPPARSSATRIRMRGRRTARRGRSARSRWTR